MCKPLWWHDNHAQQGPWREHPEPPCPPDLEELPLHPAPHFGYGLDEWNPWRPQPAGSGATLWTPSPSLDAWDPLAPLVSTPAPLDGLPPLMDFGAATGPAPTYAGPLGGLDLGPSC